MLEDLFYCFLILDEGNDAHWPVAPGADEGVYLPGSSPGQAPIFRISPPDAGKPCPVLAVLFYRYFMRHKCQAGDKLAHLGLVQRKLACKMRAFCDVAVFPQQFVLHDDRQVPVKASRTT